MRPVAIGPVAAIAMAVSFSGEAAWELHVPVEQAQAAHAILTGAGAADGITPFGLYATESMRLEKGYRHWKADLIDEADPFESGLERFVRLDKPSFPGRTALLDRPAPRQRFVSLRLDSDAAPAQPGDAILSDGMVVGSVTSAGWGYRVAENLAMGFVTPDHSAEGARLDVLVQGRSLPAHVVAPCRYDPTSERIRL